VHEWIAEDEDIIVGIPAHDHVAGFLVHSPAGDLRRKVIEIIVADDRPSMLGLIIDLQVSVIRRTPTAQSQLVSGMRIQIRMVDLRSGIGGSTLAAWVSVEGLRYRAEADRIFLGPKCHEGSEDEDADVGEELEFGAGFDGEGHALHHGQVAAYNVRLRARLQPKVLCDPASDWSAHVKDGPTNKKSYRLEAVYGSQW